MPTSSFAATPLAGKTAIVTGASRGIGAAIASALAEQGVRVALVARTEPLLKTLAQKIGGGAFSALCDLTLPESVAAAAKVVRREFGGAPDIIVNNAGLFELGAVHETSPSMFDSIVRTNLTAPFLLTHEFLSQMLERKTGHVVTIGSIADRHVMPENGAYSAAKYGLRALHEVLRLELNGSGVRATLVSPGAVDTNLWDKFLTDDVPEGRMLPDRSIMLQPAAIADAVVYAISQPPTVNIDELRLSHS